MTKFADRFYREPATEGQLDPHGWRADEYPEHAVHAEYGNDRVVVLADSGGVARFSRDYVGRHAAPANAELNAARAYFAAHPEPMPWQHAKPGEVWLFNDGGREFAGVINVDHAIYDGSTNDWFDLDYPDIRSARRIWPEEEA